MFRTSLALFAAGLLSAPAFAGDLGLGDPAPAIDVKWVKGEPVNALAADGTYVVEFWATWCGPCIKSIPHISELQAKYADQLTVIGVSVWERDQAKVAPFVEKMGDKMAYRVAMDVVEGDKGRMASAWMEASGARGIPTAFIVDDGKIAWIGHPMEMDEPLAQVLSGEYDVQAAIAKREKEMAAEKLYQAAMQAAQKGDWKLALAKIDELVAVDAGMEAYLAPTRFTALVNLGQFDEASTYGMAFVKGLGKDNAQALNALAWTIVDPTAEFEKRDLKLALAAAQRASDLTEHQEPAILDTLAKVHFDLGNVEKAVEIQQKAVDLSKGTDWEAELTRRLEQYKGVAKS